MPCASRWLRPLGLLVPSLVGEDGQVRRRQTVSGAECGGSLATFTKRRSSYTTCEFMTVCDGWAMLFGNGQKSLTQYNKLQLSGARGVFGHASGVRSLVPDLRRQARLQMRRRQMPQQDEGELIPGSGSAAIPRSCPIPWMCRCATVTRTVRAPRTRLAVRTTAVAPTTSSECVAVWRRCLANGRSGTRNVNVGAGACRATSACRRRRDATAWRTVRTPAMRRTARR